MWKGPTEATKSFADVKPTCMGQVPKHDVFADDFKTILKNVTDIIDLWCTECFKERRGVLMDSKVNPRLKFCHILFEVRRNFLHV
jgi:hypothetical protein